MTLVCLALLFSQTVDSGPQIDFSQVWAKTEQAIERSYYARQSRKEEMDERLKRYAPIASAAKSKDEFRSIIEKMIAEFKDSHFDFYTTDDQGFYLMDNLAKANPAQMPEFGAWFRKTPDGYSVQMVLNGTEAEKAGLMKGDLVSTVDGAPFTPIASIQDDVGKKVTLGITRGGVSMQKEVTVESKTALGMFLDATIASERIINEGGKKIGYVHLWTEATDKFASTLASFVYNQFRTTDACILDLRDGFGGRPEGYGDPFFRPEVHLDWKYSQFTTHEIFGYQRPLVVLINGGSRSAKEVLSFVFKKSRRATLIGSNTAGNVLGTFPNRIADWAYIEIPIADVVADGVRLEGKGVAPDISVPQEFDKQGDDLYVEQAVKFLEKR